MILVRMENHCVILYNIRVEGGGNLHLGQKKKERKNILILIFLCSNRPKHACFGLKTWSPPQKLDMHTFASAPAMTRFITLYAEIQIIDGTVQDCDNLSCFGENPSYFSKLLYNVQWQPRAEFSVSFFLWVGVAHTLSGAFQNGWGVKISSG